MFAIKEGYEFNDDSQSKMVAFSIATQIERNQISRRTNESLAMRKERGERLGRPVGSQNVDTKLSGKEAEVRALLDKKIAHAAIARIFEVDRRTVSYFIKTRLTPGSSPEEDTSHAIDLTTSVVRVWDGKVYVGDR